MSAFNTQAFAARWKQLSLMEQLGNIGSEVDRAIAWHRKGELQRSTSALNRALELFDLTISDLRWRTGGKLKELVRAREVLCDAFFGDNEYGTSLESLSRYFYYFAWAARRRRCAQG